MGKRPESADKKQEVDVIRGRSGQTSRECTEVVHHRLQGLRDRHFQQLDFITQLENLFIHVRHRQRLQNLLIHEVNT